MDESKTGENGVVFFEVQHIGMKWVWVMMGVIWVFMLGGLWWILDYMVSSGFGFGGAEGMVICSWLVAFLFTLVIPLMTSRTRMEVTIDGERIRIYLWPWFRREFAVDKVVEVRARMCRPFVEFGSRGARRRRGWGYGYLIKGDWGADVTMADGKHVFIGSQNAAELKQALDNVKSATV